MVKEVIKDGILVLGHGYSLWNGIMSENVIADKDGLYLLLAWEDTSFYYHLCKLERGTKICQSFNHLFGQFGPCEPIAYWYVPEYTQSDETWHKYNIGEKAKCWGVYILAFQKGDSSQIGYKIVNCKKDEFIIKDLIDPDATWYGDSNTEPLPEDIIYEDFKDIKVIAYIPHFEMSQEQMFKHDDRIPQRIFLVEHHKSESREFDCILCNRNYR